MTAQRTAERRWDRTVRSAMWCDALLSTAAVVASVVAIPLVALLGLSHTAVLVVAAIALGSAVLLAAFGAVTAIALMVRMHHGEYLLPPDLRLPLPPGLRPQLVTATRRRSRDQVVPKLAGARSATPARTSRHRPEVHP